MLLMSDQSWLLLPPGASSLSSAELLLVKIRTRDSSIALWSGDCPAPGGCSWPTWGAALSPGRPGWHLAVKHWGNISSYYMYHVHSYSYVCLLCIKFILMYHVFFIMHHVYHNYYVLCIILLLRIMCILIILAHYTDTLLLLPNIKLMVEIDTAILNRKQSVRQTFYWNNKHWNKTWD